MASQQTADAESAVTFSAVGDRYCATTLVGAEGLRSCSLAGIFLSLIHLLLELLCLLLVHKREACQTLFEFERVEEGSVLVVLESVVDLLVPNDASTRGLRSISVHISCASRWTLSLQIYQRA